MAVYAQIPEGCTYDNGTLIRDYVPCIRKSDGVSGLWDKINNTFNTPNTIA